MNLDRQSLNLVIVITCILLIIASNVESKPTSYTKGIEVPLFMNTIGPYYNPSETYEYYSLPFCEPENFERKKQTLGETLEGDRQSNSRYSLPFNTNIENQELCDVTLTTEDIQKFIKAIKEYYFFEMIYDGLPVKGFVGATDPVGIDDSGEAIVHHYLFRHLHFNILYNGDHVIHINATADMSAVVELDTAESIRVKFSYSASWIPTEITYKERMQLYRNPYLDEELEIHWLSIMNSLILVLLLTGFIAIIIVRVLRSDYSRYSKDISEEEDPEDYGWKLIHGDVFRFPIRKNAFCALFGVGAQLLAVSLSILLLSVVGFLYPEKRGSLYSASIILYALTSAIAGMVSSGFYKKLNGDRWAWNVIVVATLFAIPVGAVTVFANAFAKYYETTSAMPLMTMIQVLAIWLLVGFPLTLIGGIAGRHMVGPFEVPVRTKNFPREIPIQPWYRNVVCQMAIAGFLPFSAIYIELYYIYASIWAHSSYTLYGILFLVFVILLVVTACITIALTYFQLSLEDYNWWWRSFLSGGSTGFFIFGYSIYYYFYRSNMSGTLQAVKFFSYVTITCYYFFIMLGTVGFYSSLVFVRHIYKNLKFD